MFGFFIYLSSLVYVPHAIILVGFVILVIQNPKYTFSSLYNFIRNPNFKVNTNNFIVFSIVIASMLNMVYNLNKVSSFGDFFPYFILIPFTYYIAKVVKPSQWRWLLYFVAIECLIGVFQFIIGQPSFFPEFLKFPEVYDPNLLYYRRVYGLSTSSSTFANKILLALLLSDYCLKKSLIKQVLTVLFWLGLFVTFNRTVLIVVVIYYGLKYIQANLKTKFKPTQFYLNALLVFIGSIFLFFLLWRFSGEIISQFTRDRDGLDISGRDKIWLFFWDFIKTHLFFGNGGFKVYNPKGLHAHNSFIQVLATNGFLIFCLYLLLIFRNLRNENLISVLILIIYSLTQYGIFWGISLMDMAFFYLLLRPKGPADTFEFARETKVNWRKLFPLRTS